MNIRTSAFRGLAILSLSVLGLAACDEKDPVTPVPVPEVTVTVTPASLDLEVGQTGDLVAIVGNSTNQAVTWSTSNNAVATVSATGRVTAVAPGAAVITATSAADGTKRAAAGVTVRAAPPVVLTVQPTAATLNVGGTVQLVPNVTGTTNTAVTYATSASNVATVSTAGVVTAVGPGTAIITTRSSADNTKVATTQITVLTPPAVSVTVSPSQATVDVGGTVQFVSTVTGSTNTAVTWTSSQQSVATITASGGLATAVGSGTTVITATSAADPTKVATAVLTVSALPPVVISATPQNVSINPGANQTVTVGISGGNNAAAAGFTATTSDAAIATVQVLNGTSARITGVASGTATITLTSVADPSKSTAVTVTVASVTQPSISIQSVTTPGGVPIAPGTAVAGVINVNMNVTAGSQTNISAVEVRLNGAVACTQTFTPPLAPTQGVATISCPINTATVNADGTATFPNGTYSLTAHALSGGSVVASATYGSLVFANPNVVGLTISTVGVTSSGSTTASGSGLLWNEGSVVVTATPTQYAGGAVSSMTICLNIPAGATDGTGGAAVSTATTPCRTDATAADGFSVTFPKGSTIAANGVAGVSNSNVTPYVLVSTTAAGGSGATTAAGTGPSIRLDNLAPTTGALTLVAPATNGWVGANYAFSAGYTPAAAPEDPGAPANGVNVVTRTYHVGTAASTTATIAATAAVSTGADVAESPTNTTYALVVRVVDALGNAATLRMAAPATLGVDLTAPTSVTVTGPATGTNVTAILPVTWTIGSADALSGPGTPATRIMRQVPTAIGTRCYVGTVSGSSCLLQTAAPATIAAGAPDDYYLFSGEARDQAGNAVAVTDREVVVDATAPGVQNIVLPSTLPSGGTASFSAVATDNLDLMDYVTRTIYAGAAEPFSGGAATTELPYSNPVAIGTFGYADGRITSTAVSQDVNFIRSVEYVAGDGPGGANDVPSAAVVSGSGQRFTVRDFGLNSSTAFNNFAAGTVTAGTSATGLGVNDFFLGGTPATICDPSATGQTCGSGGVTASTSSALTATVRGTSGTFNAPFSRVIFYRVDATGTFRYIGETTARLSTDNGVAADPVGRVWTYSGVSIAGTGLGAAGAGATLTHNIVAVGVDAAGDALISLAFVLTVN